MAFSWRELFGRSRHSQDDLENFRRRLIEQPEDFMDVGDGYHNQEQHNHAPDGIGRSGAVVLCVLCGLALGMAIYSQIEAAKAERETRMLEYYVMELDG